jgi:heme-degrading monooxygenase HmoA
MILEAAFLYVKKDLEQDFEVDFKKASQYISSIDGYLKYSLQKCLEVEKTNIYCL